ncbi:sugar transferase [Halomarina oriensis]|uniref:Sugar transferase n=1 Tax=Halomarina oriensis TaxID=671145 RepID=A0A6B0GIH2_9EURY|nr:sugar transferase [Halomarina oriensis]MWG34430.1 sugar transferase [Halomarina oriensis]
MTDSVRHRLMGVGGVFALTALAVVLVNNPAVQSFATSIPVLRRLSPDPPGTAEFLIELLVTVCVFLLAFLPLYRPRPRRILDVLVQSVERVVLAGLVLASIGYFDYTYRLPRFTLLVVVPFLGVALPLWFVWIRRRPARGTNRAVVIGDDPRGIERDIEESDVPLLGYLCPSSRFRSEGESVQALADGGVSADGLERLGGLSRIEDVLVSYDVDTAVLAFEQADRAEFFGALDACHRNGVDAKVHREHADSVLTSEDPAGPLVNVEVEPWDVEDYLLKRTFDVAFSLVGLVVLAPVICLIALAVKLDDGGPVLYRQARTAVFGDTFDVYKFRTMTPAGESETPVEDAENDRITDVGRWLRRTHLDEVPQLWSILKGDMSVVGPRAVWTAEEDILEAESETWRKRWFIKPGLTGLAQIHDAKSTDPTAKHYHDMRYVAEQSFWLDVKIITRQVWGVCEDVWGMLFTRQ